MTLPAILLGIAVVMLGLVIFEKKRGAGPLTYPLWRGNLLIPWGILAAAFLVLMGALNLPQVVGLTLRGLPTDATVLKTAEFCKVTYSYHAAGKDFTGVDSKCGLKPQSTHRVFYDSAAPESSSLIRPRQALMSELMAMGVIAFCLPTVLVLWLMLTHVIGRKKPT